MLVEQLPILDLDVWDLRDMNVLTIVDASTYLTVPDPSLVSLQITPPTGNTINVPFTPGSVNMYKSVDLGLSSSPSECAALPDGIYHIIYTIVSSPNSPQAQGGSVNLTVIKIDQLRCAYEHAFIAIDLECSCSDTRYKQFSADLERAKLYMTASVAESNRGNLPLAYKYYNRSEFILNNIACKFSGKCSGNGAFSGCGCSK